MAITIARPSATSAAAIVMMNIENTCPVSSRCTIWSPPLDGRPYSEAGTVYLENATAAKFTALNISSIDMSTAIALRFDSAPYSPIAKSIAETIRKLSRLNESPFANQRQCANDSRQQYDGRHFESQHEVLHE